MTMETSISSHHRNKRYHFPLATYDSEHFGPLLAVTEKSANDKQWLDNVLAAFEPFVHTPDGQPRPLTVRLSVDPKTPIKSLKGVVTKLQAGRKEGKMGPAEIHRLSVLVAFEDRITVDEIGVIERIMKL